VGTPTIMKKDLVIKFIAGPWHGKVMAIPAPERGPEPINVEVFDQRDPFNADFLKTKTYTYNPTTLKDYDGRYFYVLDGFDPNKSKLIREALQIDILPALKDGDS